MRSMILCLLCLFAAAPVLAQHGGKAEPNRIEFAAGHSSKTLTGTLSNDQEMEYVFSAGKGQRVTLRNAKPNEFEVRIFSDEFNFANDFDGSPTLTFELPDTGDYNLFVRKKNAKWPKRATFSLNLSIK